MLARQISLALLMLGTVTTASVASEDRFELSDLGRLQELMRGFGSAKEAKCSDNGMCSIEGRVNGFLYFVNVFSDDGKKCEKNCTASINSCNTGWSVSPEALNGWNNKHWSVVTDDRNDGVCYSLYLNPYRGDFREDQIEAAFELFVSEVTDFLALAKH